MSIMEYEPIPPSPLSTLRRQVWSQMFGTAIHRLRESRGRSIEETALLAGMESSEWAAIEAGHVPTDPGQLHPMAAALEVRYADLARLAIFCRGAWEQ